MKGKGDMTTYFLTGKKNGQRLSRPYLQPSNPSNAGGGGGGGPGGGGHNQYANGGQGGQSGHGGGGGGGGNVGNNNTNNNNSAAGPGHQQQQRMNRGGPVTNVTSFAAQQQQQPIRGGMRPLSGSGLWSHGLVDSPRMLLPVIREDIQLVTMGGAPSQLSISDNSQRVPSYNEPKPIIFDQKPVGTVESDDAVAVSMTSLALPPGYPGGSGAGSRLSSATPEGSCDLNGNISTVVAMQETNLDVASQHDYGQIRPSTSAAAVAGATSRGFFFDNNSSSNIKSQLLEQYQPHRTSAAASRRLLMSPAMSSRTDAFSLADTTKATIQSQESLDKLLDESNYGAGVATTHRESSIYNISSDEDDSSQYGHIVKRNYMRECLDNNFYKNQRPLLNGNVGGRKAGNVAGYNLDANGNRQSMPTTTAAAVNNDDNNDDYCVFIKRDQPQAPPPPALKSIAKTRQLPPPLEPRHPDVHFARNQRHYQAHNSPLIVHRFYHLDDSNRNNTRPMSNLVTNNNSKPTSSNNNNNNHNARRSNEKRSKRRSKRSSDHHRSRDIEKTAQSFKYPLGWGQKQAAEVNCRNRASPLTSSSHSSSLTTSDSEDDLNSVAAAVMSSAGSKGYTNLAHRLLDRSNSFNANNSPGRRKCSLPDYYKSRAPASGGGGAPKPETSFYPPAKHTRYEPYGKINRRNRLSSLESLDTNNAGAVGVQIDCNSSIFSIESYRRSNGSRNACHNAASNDNFHLENDSSFERKMSQQFDALRKSNLAKLQQQFEAPVEAVVSAGSLSCSNSNFASFDRANSSAFRRTQEVTTSFMSNGSITEDNDPINQGDGGGGGATTLLTDNQHKQNYESDNSYLADEEDEMNNNGNNNQPTSINVGSNEDEGEDSHATQHFSSSASVTLMGAVGNEHHNGDGKMFSSMYNECPDNHSLDFDRIPAATEADEFLFAPSSKASSSSSSVHETTDGALSDILYDSDGGAIVGSNNLPAKPAPANGVQLSSQRTSSPVVYDANMNRSPKLVNSITGRGQGAARDTNGNHEMAV